MASDPFTLQFCVDDNLRIFARMLACLDRVGKDLYLEASGGQVPRPVAPRPSGSVSIGPCRALDAGVSAHAERCAVRLRQVPPPVSYPAHAA